MAEEDLQKNNNSYLSKCLSWEPHFIIIYFIQYQQKNILFLTKSGSLLISSVFYKGRRKVDLLCKVFRFFCGKSGFVRSIGGCGKKITKCRSRIPSYCGTYLSTFSVDCLYTMWKIQLSKNFKNQPKFKSSKVSKWQFLYF